MRTLKCKPSVGAKGVQTARACTIHRRIYRVVSGLQCRNLRKFGATYSQVHVCTNARCIWKWSYGGGEPKIANPQSVQEVYKPPQACTIPIRMPRPVWPTMEIWQIRGYISPDIVFAPMQGAHEREAMGEESMKLQTLSRCKKRTDLHGSAKYHVACCAVYVGPTMEICANSRLHIPRFRVCTNASCIRKGSYGGGEHEIANPQSVQKAYRPVRACTIHRRIPRR